jgi:hypothetical protein
VTISFVYLLPALILLWLPRHWLRRGPRMDIGGRRSPRPRVDKENEEPGIKPLAEMSKGRNWSDFLRAAVGGHVITSLAVLPPAELSGPHKPTLWLVGVLLGAGVLVQMLRVEGRVTLFAPVFYLQGLSLGVVGALTGSLAMVGSWVLTPILPGVGAILFVQGGVVLILGLLFENPAASPALVMITSGLVWTPVLTSVLFRKRLSAAFEKRSKVVARMVEHSAPGSRKERGGRR